MKRSCWFVISHPSVLLSGVCVYFILCPYLMLQLESIDCGTCAVQSKLLWQIPHVCNRGLRDYMQLLIAFGIYRLE